MGKENQEKIIENYGDDMWHGGGKWEEVSPTLIKFVD